MNREELLAEIHKGTAMFGKWLRASRRRRDREFLWLSLQAAARSHKQELFLKWMHVCSDSAWRYREEWKDEEPELNAATKEGMFDYEAFQKAKQESAASTSTDSATQTGTP